MLALFFRGGDIIHGFSLAIFIGVDVGTYSSMYLASNTDMVLGVSREDLMTRKGEGKPSVEETP